MILHVAPNGEQNERIIIDNIPVTSQVIRGSLQHVCLSISLSTSPPSVRRSVRLSELNSVYEEHHYIRTELEEVSLEAEVRRHQRQMKVDFPHSG